MTPHEPASIFKRIAALFYDCLLLIAVFFVITAVAVRVNGGEAIESPLYLMALIPVAWIFFAWFWINGGQTLGMRAWKIKLVNESGDAISVRSSVIRFAVGFVFFPFVLLPALFDNDKRGLHDKLAGTKILRIKQY